MTLYSADVFDLAKPVPKKGKGKAPVGEVKEPEIPVEKEKKEKKAPTEKQLAALAKAQETRKRKREEAESATVAAQKLEQERIDKETEVKQKKEQKKQEQKEKRRQKKIEKGPATPPPTEVSSSNGSEELSLEEAIDHEVKKMKTSSSNSDPPTWFKQYVAGVKKEEAKISREKKPKKQIQEEAREVAQTSWADGFTRDRVRNEVDGHMSRMYQMMFGGRRMK